MPIVSICLTTYNRGNLLRNTIDSILNQTFKDFELIISDDNSTDNTSVICNEYVKKDIRVKYFKNEVNLKMPGNLNSAILKASGVYIANLHDGDIYRPDLIEKWFLIIDANPEVNFVFNQYTMLDSNNNILRVYNHKFSEVEDGFSIRKYLYTNLSSAPWGTVMVRKSAYQKVGNFKPEYGFISDVEMWMRLSKVGKVGYVNEPLIDLTPRERNHKYYYPEANIFYINLLIVFDYYKNEQNIISVDKNIIIKKIKNQLRQEMLLLVKYKKISRLKGFNYLLYHSGFMFELFYLIPLFVLSFKKPQQVDLIKWKSICRMTNLYQNEFC